MLAAISTQNWISAGLISLAAVLAVALLHRMRDAIVNRFDFRDYVVDTARRILIGIILVVAFLYVLQLLEVELSPLLGGLGISSIIVAVALQPVFGNLVGSILLHGSRYFRPGDQIETNGIVGTVIDISFRSVELLNFDGVRVYVPNLKVLDAPLTNQTADELRRTTLRFQVSYDSDLRETQKVTTRALRLVDGIADMPAAEILVENFEDSGISMMARFWHPSEELSARWIVSEAAIAIRETLAENDITIPYPHLVVQNGSDRAPSRNDDDADHSVNPFHQPDSSRPKEDR